MKKDKYYHSVYLSIILYLSLSTHKRTQFPDWYVLIKQRLRRLTINAVIPDRRAGELANSCSPHIKPGKYSFPEMNRII